MRIFDTRWHGPHGIGRFSSEIHGRLAGFSPIEMRGRPSSPLDPLRLSRHLRAVRPDLFFSPGYNAPLGAPCPFVFCIHDLNHLCVRQNSSPLKRAYYELIIRPGVRRARAVLTVSEFSRNAICEWAGVTPERVANVGNGVSEVFRTEGPVHPGPGRPYFLHVGNHRPHKNFDGLLRAFAASRLPGSFALVSTGRPSDEVRRTVARLRLTDSVTFMPEVSDDQLAALYRGALALAFVSLYEGFGLPIVEAMACGTPVLSSNVASMPEVAGDAAILVDPTDTDAIREGLERLAGDEALRQELRSRGLERAKLFSWEKTARKVAEAFEQFA